MVEKVCEAIERPDVVPVGEFAYGPRRRSPDTGEAQVGRASQRRRVHLRRPPAAADQTDGDSHGSAFPSVRQEAPERTVLQCPQDTPSQAETYQPEDAGTLSTILFMPALPLVWVRRGHLTSSAAAGERPSPSTDEMSIDTTAGGTTHFR
jgi:hypothetical protein